MFDYHFNLMEKHIEQNKRLGLDFVVKKSRFSGKIEINGQKISYGKKSVKVSAFGYSATLKKELRPHLEYFKGDGKNRTTGYFLLGNKIERKRQCVYNIDISSAYLYALKNTGFISKEIFDKIKNQDKLSRLVTLGLLAYQPVLFSYEKGILEDALIIKNEFREAFFYCVREVFYISQMIKNKIGDDFLFSWVDGFYFYEEKNIHVISDYLKSKRYGFKLCRLFNFEIDKKNEYFSFSYKKMEKKEIENKKICVPVSERLGNKFFFSVNEAMKDNDKEKFNQILEEFLI